MLHDTEGALQCRRSGSESITPQAGAGVALGLLTPTFVTVWLSEGMLSSKGKCRADAPTDALALSPAAQHAPWCGGRGVQVNHPVSHPEHAPVMLCLHWQPRATGKYPFTAKAATPTPFGPAPCTALPNALSTVV
ncbi:hypothetical protein ABBQ38_005522 [Trebouxia sp. C0009 RCD-2024]